jgi:hypothetical protein
MIQSGVIWAFPCEDLSFALVVTTPAPEGGGEAAETTGDDEGAIEWDSSSPERTRMHTEHTTTSRSWSRSGRSEEPGRAGQEGLSESRSKSEGTGCKNCGRHRQTTTDSETWSQTEGHAEPL